MQTQNIGDKRCTQMKRRRFLNPLSTAAIPPPARNCHPIPYINAQSSFERFCWAKLPSKTRSHEENVARIFLSELVRLGALRKTRGCAQPSRRVGALPVSRWTIDARRMPFK